MRRMRPLDSWILAYRERQVQGGFRQYQPERLVHALEPEIGLNS